MPVDRLWCVIAQRTLLGSCYAPSAEKCYNPISFSHKPKTEFQYTSVGNAAIIKIIAKCSRYCRLLLAKWNSVKHYNLFNMFWHVASDLGYSEDVVCMPKAVIFDFMRRS